MNTRKHAPDGSGDGPKGRSPDQRRGSAAMTQVMALWEDLTDPERLSWRVQAKSRRTKGVTFFKTVNLRRLRRGQHSTRVPIIAKPRDGRPLLKRLLVSNPGGWLTLKLEFRRAVTEPTTVWGSRPCNRGLERPRKCPRLGWLPAAKGGVANISAQYYQKHGEWLWAHEADLVGKRIFIRIRIEVDYGVPIYEEVSALVPEPKRPAERKNPQ